MTRDELIAKVAERIGLPVNGCPGVAIGLGEGPCNIGCNVCWATAIVNLVESCREEGKPDDSTD
jgi:hypothetical protein